MGYITACLFANDAQHGSLFHESSATEAAPPLSYHTQPCLFTGIFCMRERSQPERTKWINGARWYLYVSYG